MSTSLSPVEHGVRDGLLVGFAEVYTCHPLWVIKTRLQCGYPFTLHLPTLYRGALAEAVTMCPVDIVIMVVSTYFNDIVFDNKDNRSFEKRAASSALGGATGGVMINSIEFVMTLQQKYTSSFSAVLRKLAQTGRVRQLFIGAAETATRNSIYNTGFFAVAPRIDAMLRPKIEQKQLCSFTAGAIAGTGVAIISHPFDYIKTLRQESEGAMRFWQTVNKIHKTQGFIGFFTGVQARSARVIVGIAAMTLVYQTANNN